MDNVLLNDVKPLSNVYPLRTVKPLQNVTGLQNVTPLTFKPSYSNSNTGLLQTFNTDVEPANSILDVLYSRAQRNALLRKNGLDWFTELPDEPLASALGGVANIFQISRLAAVGALLKNKYVDPIRDAISGDITLAQAGKEITFNTLIELSEDLDILSNLVKSQFESAGGKPGLESLSNALGFNGKRYVYNFNTGNTVADIALETLSDPLTWVSLGTTAVASGGKTAMNSAVKSTAKELTEEASENSIKQLSKAVTKTVTKEGSQATAESVLKNVSRKTIAELGEENVKKVLPDLLQTAIKNDGYRIYLKASALKASVNAVDEGFTKMIMYSTPLGIPADFAKKIVAKGAKAIYNGIVRQIEKFDLDAYFIGNSGTYRDVVKSALYKNVDMNKKIFEKNTKFFRDFGISSTDLQTEYLKFLRNAENKGLKITDPAQDFWSYLLRNKENFNTVRKIKIKDYGDFAKSDLWHELVEATAVAPHAINAAFNGTQQAQKVATINSMQKYISQHKNDLEDIYKYIDKNVLKINDEYFGLANFDEFLKRINADRTISWEYKRDLNALLGSLGINLANAHNIDKVLNSSTKNKTKAIKNLIEKTHSGVSLTSQKDYNAMLSKVSKQTQNHQGKALDKALKKDITVFNNKRYSEIMDTEYKTIQQAVRNIQNNMPFQIGDNTYKGVPIVYDSSIKVPMVTLNNEAIKVNKDLIQEYFETGAYKNRSYIKLRNKTFNSVDELAQYIMDHEYQHVLKPFNDVMPSGSLKTNLKDRTLYEAGVDKYAMKDLAAQQHPVDYIRNAIRLQDLPEEQAVIDALDRAIQNRGEALGDINRYQYHDYLTIKKYLKDTNRILNTMDSNLSVYNDIIQWWQDTDGVLSAIQETKKALLNAGEYGPQARELLNRLEKSVDLFKNGVIKDDIINYVDTVEGMLVPQMKHQYMFDVFTQHTHMSNNKEMKYFLEQMSNPESYYRQYTIPTLIEAFDKASMPEYSANIKKVVAQIDTVTNLNKMLATEIPTSFVLTNRMQDDLKSILFDTLKNHENWLISDILTEDAMEDIVTKRQILKDAISNTIDNTAVIQDRITEVMTKNNLISREDVTKEIKEQLYNILDTYIHDQSIIGNTIDNVSLYTIYNQDTMDALALTTATEFDLARNLGEQFTSETMTAFEMAQRDFFVFAENLQLSIDEIQKFNEKLRGPIAYSELNSMLKKQVISYNQLSASIESQELAFKYLAPDSYNYIDKSTGKLTHVTGFAEKYKLPKEAFSGSNEEYVMLIEKLKTYENIEHEAYKYEEAYLKRSRECLAITYSRPNALFAPVNPSEYFYTIEPQEVLTWETFTKGNASINNKTAWYDADIKLRQGENLLKHDYRLSQSDEIARIDTVMRNSPYSDDNAMIEISNIARNSNAVEYANRYIDADLMQTLHSLDDLDKYKDDLVELLEHNVDQTDDIMNTIMSLENDSRLYDHYAGDFDFGNINDLRDLGQADYGYELNIRKNNIAMYAERKSTQALSIANMSAEELATHIYRQTPGGMVFHNHNIIRIKNADGSTVWAPLENVFNFTDEELKNAGLKIMKETTVDGDWYYIRLTDNRVHDTIPKYESLVRTHDTQQIAYTDLIDKYRNYLNMWEYDDVPSNILTVEMLNEDTWNKFVDSHIDFFGNTEEQKLYQKLTKDGHSNFFNKSFERLNLTVIGGYDTYNIWNKMYSETFIPHSNLMSRNTMSGLLSSVQRSNKINKYLTLFFNRDYALDNALFTKMFSEASDERIKEFFKTNKYRVVILRKDKQGLPKVFEYHVSNRAQLERAISIGAIMVPDNTFTAMKQVVNNRKLSNNLLDVYRRVGPATYKTMYLYTAGFPFRNSLDSLIYKNTNELGGITEIPKVVKYEYEASKALELHNEIQKAALDLSGGETFNKETLLKVLSERTVEEQEVYYLTDIFMGSPAASSTLSDSLTNFLQEYNKKHSPELRPLWEAFYEDQVLYGKQKLNPLHHMAELNNHIEMTARYGLFLASVDSGMPFNDALARVVRTHFDYDSAPDLLEMCERIFWFATFPINNLNYYVNGGLTKSPTLLRLLFDTQTASWNNGEYTYEELKKTNFLAYHAMTGNIRIGNWIIKTSPSVFDFIGLVTNFPTQLKERLNPILAVPLGAAELSELNPLQSQFRLFPKQFQGNPIPSILSRIQDKDWTPTLGRWRSAYRRSWTSYPRRSHIHRYNMYFRKYYARRYSTRVRDFTRLSLYRDAYKYYKVYKRGATYYDL